MSLQNADVATETLVLVTSDPDILGGAQVFAGTRVHVTTLLITLQRATHLMSFSTTFRPSNVSKPWRCSNNLEASSTR